MSILLIADLHLSEDTPDLTELFVQFLRDQTGKVSALYILGDLFEAWVGDDDPTATAAIVLRAINQFSRSAPVYFMAGNRDFLLGKCYARRSNMQIIQEPTVISVSGKRILLTHGDEMCTGDVAYLRYRAVVRNPVVKNIFLHLPRFVRQMIAKKMRQTSKNIQNQNLNQNKKRVDVSTQGIQAALQHNRAIDMIIHGHTHRPDVHVHQFGSQTIVRCVLPDWKNGEGGYVLIHDTGFAMRRLPEIQDEA